MILFGGIPDLYYDRLTEIVPRRFPDIVFTGISLKPLNSRYEIDSDYCDELVETLALYCQNRPECMSEGLGVVLLRRPWESRTFQEKFWPFALCQSVAVDIRQSNRGEGRKRAANLYAERAIETARRVNKKVKSLTMIYQTELRRTPLLLPIRSFASPILRELFLDLHDSLQSPRPVADAVRTATQQFSSQYERRPDGRGSVFIDDSKVQFKAPPRNVFHGHRPTKANENGHNVGCFINARIRLGGYYADGFHYDCTRGSCLEGQFSNCHDYSAKYRGRPHLNIFPNDFIMN